MMLLGSASQTASHTGSYYTAMAHVRHTNLSCMGVATLDLLACVHVLTDNNYEHVYLADG